MNRESAQHFGALWVSIKSDLKSITVVKMIEIWVELGLVLGLNGIEIVIGAVVIGVGGVGDCDGVAVG